MKLKLFVFSISVLVFVAFSAFQLIKTNLKITVLNTTGNPVEGAEVQLFSTLEDFESESNPVTEMILTDKKGIANFKGLETKSYFVIAQKDGLNNFGMGNQTDTLSTSKINKVNIIID